MLVPSDLKGGNQPSSSLEGYHPNMLSKCLHLLLESIVHCSHLHLIVFSFFFAIFVLLSHLFCVGMENGAMSIKMRTSM